jgi:uncharacterized protein
MRIQDGRESQNVEDRRGSRGTRRAGIGLGTVVVAVVIGLALGRSPLEILGIIAQQPGGVATEAEGPVQSSAEEEASARLVKVVLADTEVVWGDLFQKSGSAYREPTLVLFRDAVASACGNASSAMGPFYCPGDQKVYLDLGFFDELGRRFGAPGDFAQAYVVAHEIGHHVQNLVGTNAKVAQAQARMSEADANALSVRLELQADCFAGVWAHHAHTERKLLEEGDVEEGLRAAAAIGDDTLQKKSSGRVVPESFTHGSSAERVQWLKTGLKSGSVQACDTFGA